MARTASTLDGARRLAGRTLTEPTPCGPSTRSSHRHSPGVTPTSRSEILPTLPLNTWPAGDVSPWIIAVIPSRHSQPSPMARGTMRRAHRRAKPRWSVPPSSSRASRAASSWPRSARSSARARLGSEEGPASGEGPVSCEESACCPRPPAVPTGGSSLAKRSSNAQPALTARAMREVSVYF
jgi:hypothetical protein